MKLVAVALAIALGCWSARCHAAPMLGVSQLGLNGSGNREWLVTVAPDETLFAQTPGGFGGRVTVELGFEVIDAELLSVAKNAADWPLDSPGNNPFTGAVSLGLSVDQNADVAFAALTSVLLTTGNPVPVLVFETVGDQAVTLSWGGQILLGGTQFQYVGARIAQGGVNFDDFQGNLAVPAVSADFDGDSDVDGADFLLWQRGLGDSDSDGQSDAVDLGVWKAEFGPVVAASASSPATVGVPEPPALGLALAAISAVLTALSRRNRAVRSRNQPNSPEHRTGGIVA